MEERKTRDAKLSVALISFSEAMSSTGSAFAEFCDVSASQQRGDGFEVPSQSSDLFAYYQWVETAKRKFNEENPRGDDDGSATVKKTRMEEGESASQNSQAYDCQVDLAEPIAHQILASLNVSTEEGRVPLSLQRAIKEPFPMPTAAGDTESFLCLSEAVMRLTLWNSESIFLSTIAAQLRLTCRILESNGFVPLQWNRFPSLKLLMDLVSWRIIVRRWDHITPEARQVAIDSMKTLCRRVECAVSEELSAAAEKLNVAVGSLSKPVVSRHNALTSKMSASIPFQFSACRELPNLYPEPTGVLHVPVFSTESEGTGDAQEILSVDEEDTLRVGDIVRKASVLHPRATVGTAVVPTSSSHEEMEIPYEPHPVHSSLVRRHRGTNSSCMRSVTTTVDGYPSCVSQFHQRYADASKHASRACRYCATCHLMEIIFRNCQHDCACKHWPTAGKIKYNLSKHPAAFRLAMERFEKLQRGEQLAVVDGVLL